MILRIDPTVDYAFRRIFGREVNQISLIALINAVLQEPPEHCVTALEIRNPFQDKDFLEDKLSVLDIKARDASGRQFNVEMQMLASEIFRHRALYYWARHHQSQLPEGAEYGTMRPTIMICFVSTRLFPKQPPWHTTFELRERKSGILFSDQSAIHVLELPKFTKAIHEVSTPLERWMYSLCHGAELDPDKLSAELEDPAIRHALGEMQMMTQSELEREALRSPLEMAARLCRRHARCSARRRSARRAARRGARQGGDPYSAGADIRPPPRSTHLIARAIAATVAGGTWSPGACARRKTVCVATRAPRRREVTFLSRS